MTRTERLLRLAKLRGDRAAELILCKHGEVVTDVSQSTLTCRICGVWCQLERWTEAELRAAWGDR